MTITVYCFDDGTDDSEDTYQTQDIFEARAYARKYRKRIIAREFEYSDSSVVEDCSPRRKVRYVPRIAPKEARP